MLENTDANVLPKKINKQIYLSSNSSENKCKYKEKKILNIKIKVCVCACTHIVHTNIHTNGEAKMVGSHPNTGKIHNQMLEYERA